MKISFLFRNVFTCCFLVVTISFCLAFSSKRIRSTCLEISSLQSKMIASKAVNEVIMDICKNNDEELINNEDAYVSYNIDKINELVLITSRKLLDELQDINHGDYKDIISEECLRKYNTSGIIYEIPISVIFNNAFLSSFGPYLPVRFNIMGDVLVTSKYSIESFGINNALITLFLHISFSYGVYLPLLKQVEEMNIDIPISMNLIEGDVPSYLYGTYPLGETK